MKNLFKASIKLLFVVILPILSTISVVYLLRYGSTFNGGVIDWVLPILILLITYINAFFYLGMMSRTKLLPKVSFQFMPVLGLAIAFDKNPMMLIIILPFVTIEFKKQRKTGFDTV